MQVNEFIHYNQRIKDKVAIVTGASRGIGKEIVKLFLSQGAKVVVLSRNIGNEFCEELVNEVKTENDISKNILPIPCDVSREFQVDSAIKEVINTFGGIDILVNNAGITNRLSVTNSSLDSWEEVLKINLTGSFLVSHYAIPHMIKRGGGSIVTVSSIGSYVSWKDDASYQVSKGGIESLMRSMAVDYSTYKIRVNCVCPGLIDAPMLTDFLKEHDEKQILRNNLINKIPLKRLGSPEEVARCVLFLVSEDATYITGTSLIVDGGYTIYDY